MVLFGSLPARAHDIKTSYATLVVRTDTLKLVLAIDESDLHSNFDLDENQDGMLWRQEVIAGVPEVFDYVERKVALSADGKPLALERSRGDAQPDSKGNLFMTLSFQAGLEEPPVRLELEIDFSREFGADHKTLLKILQPEKPLQQAVFAPENTRQRFVVGEREISLIDRLARLVRGLFE
jgi:hypothetical protein